MEDNQAKRLDNQTTREAEGLVATSDSIKEKIRDNETKIVKWSMAEELIKMGISRDSACRILNIPESRDCSTITPRMPDNKPGRK